LSGFLERLFSGIPRTPDRNEEKKRSELARCRFFVDEIHHFDDGKIGLQGLVHRGRAYPGEPLELVGYGKKTTVRCDEIRKGRAHQDYAWAQTHREPFLLRVKHDDPSIFRAGQVLAAPGTAENVSRCEATLEITGTPGNLEQPLSDGFQGTLHFRQATVGTTLTLPEDRALATPGETVDVELSLSEPLPLEPGDEIRLSSLGHVFAQGRVTGIQPD
jgi:translation elongation factor EF-Tu-like GTPase